MTFQITDLPYNQEGQVIYGDHTLLWYILVYAISIGVFVSMFKLW